MLQNTFDFSQALGELSQLSPAAQMFSEGSPAARTVGGARGRSAKEASRFTRMLGKAQAEKETGKPGKVTAAARPAAVQDLPKLLACLGEEELTRLWNRLKDRAAGVANLLGAGAKVSSAGAAGFPQAKSASLFGELERDTAKAKGTGKSKAVLERLELLADLVGSAVIRKAVASLKIDAKAVSDGGREAGAGSGIRAEGERRAGDAARSGRSRVVVLDLRKEEAKADPLRSDSQARATGTAPAFSRTAAAEGQDREISVLFRGATADRSGASASQTAEAARSRQPSQTFQERFLPEVVKQTGIILKDGGAGEIRLVLKPDNLGSVRIRLALSESSLEGRIVVDNNSVKELVESSLDNLRNALRQEGFQTASLQVFVGNRRTSDGAARERAEAAIALEAPWKIGAEEFERTAALFLELKPDYGLVNLIV